MAIEYKGEEILFAVEVEDEPTGTKIIRPFNQTGGSKEISADSIELSSKDKSGSDYGKVSESVSLEGILTEGDEFTDFIKKAIRAKDFVKIYEIDTRTLKAEYGMYMVSSFNREYGNEDFATYSLEATLNGRVTEETLLVLPEGAPDAEVGI